MSNTWNWFDFPSYFMIYTWWELSSTRPSPLYISIVLNLCHLTLTVISRLGLVRTLKDRGFEQNDKCTRWNREAFACLSCSVKQLFAKLQYATCSIFTSPSTEDQRKGWFAITVLWSLYMTFICADSVFPCNCSRKCWSFIGKSGSDIFNVNVNWY